MDDVMNHAMPAVGAAVGLFALGVCNDQLPGLLGQDWLGFLSPHLAAVAATLWLMPNAPVSQPKNVVGAHLVVGAVGWLVAQSGMFGDMAGTVSFVLAMMAMGMADVVHPAALAMASGGDDMMSILSPGMTGAAVLLAVHHVWFNHVKPVLDGHAKSA